MAVDLEKTERIHVWLQALELAEPPYVTMAKTVIRINGHDLPEKEVLPWVADWVCVCFDAAIMNGDVDPKSEPWGADPASVHTGLAVPYWRAFLMLVHLDPVLRRSLDSTRRLGGDEKAAALALVKQRELIERVAEAPVLRALQRLQERRQRRLDGRASRAPDALYDAERAKLRLVPKPSDRGRKR